MPEFDITLSVPLSTRELEILITCLEFAGETDGLDQEEELLLHKLQGLRYGARIKS